MERFDYLCEREPRLRTLFDLASMIGRKRGKDFCANFVWYEFIKPELCRLVGHGRKPSPRTDCKQAPIGSPVERLRSLRGKVHPSFEDGSPSVVVPVVNHASDEQSDFLMSSMAYDIAYETIYNALPDCRHDNGSRCG